MTSTLSLSVDEAAEAIRKYVRSRVVGQAGKVSFVIEERGDQRDAYHIVTGARVEVDLSKTPKLVEPLTGRD